MTRPLSSAQLQAQIEETLGEPLLTLQLLQSCSSTNQLCLELNAHKSIVIAQQQTAGRGRRGNRWVSPPGQNIYCSIGVHKKLAASHLGLIPLQVGVSIADFLQQSGFDQIRLKWPNDLLAEDKKLGGILIESRPLPGDEFYLVIGFGLNLELDAQTLESIEQGAIGLSQLSANLPERHILLAGIIPRILRAIIDFEAGDIDTLLQQFRQFDRFNNDQVIIKTQHGNISGKYIGIQRDGQLVIETEQRLQAFSAAEISLRAASGQQHAADR